MKISKTAVLTAGSALMIAGLGLMFVSASDSFPSKTLIVDPNNAVQQFVRVRIVPTESGDNSMADIRKKGNLFGIETDYNFALSRSGAVEANQISGGSMGSSILGGIINKILGGKYNGILGGKNNEITTGNNNGILGGENNRIDGNYSIIFGGKDNEISLSSGSYSAIVGGSGNKTHGSNSVVVGGNNNARGYNSVAMGYESKLNATSSFLWTDGNHSDALTNGHVFAVLGDKGMVINTTGAHDLAQLTISGSLVVYDDKNAPECTSQTKGVLKVITGDNSNTNQECFCSCDGSGRNALHEGNRCSILCDNTTISEAECGKAQRVCPVGGLYYYYTGDSTSGACVHGSLVRGTGAFLVSTHRSGGVLENYINWSCQTVDGKVKTCEQKLEGNGCPNLEHYECNGTTGDHMLLTGINPANSSEFWTYDEEGYEHGEDCTFICDDYSHWDPVKEQCIENECADLGDDYAEFNDNTELPTEDGMSPEYAPGSYNACTYHCIGGYDYDPSRGYCRELACNESTLPDYGVPNTPWSSNPTDFSQDYEYKESGHDPCTFHCEGARTYKDGACVDLSCKGPIPDHAAANDPYAIPDEQDKPYFFSDSMEACAVHCISPRTYEESEGGCVLNLQNCSVDLVEGKYGINDLAAGHKASTLGSSGPWTCEFGSDGTLKPFADVCDSDTVSSFDNTVSSVEMNEGYVFLSWIDESGRILSNTLNTLSLNCGEKAILKWKCDEDNDYGWNPEKRYCEKGFKPIVHECEGEDPANAVLIPGTDEGLPNSGIVKYVYENSTEARGKYCAYLCDSGYTYVLNHDRPQCVLCVTGTYDPETKLCEIEEGCNSIGYAYGPSPSNPGGYACLREGYCKWNNATLTKAPNDEGANDIEFYKSRPLGNNDGDWKCVEGTPENFACQYTCKDGYVCRNGKCKEVDCKFPINYENLYNGSDYCSSYFTVNGIDLHVVGIGGGPWKHVSENEPFPSKDGCYYKCPKGSVYYRRCSTDGCAKNECGNLPSYLDAKQVETVEHPNNPNGLYVFDWEYSGTITKDITKDTQVWGCFYKCADGYEPRTGANGKIECVGGECPEVTRKNLYHESETYDIVQKAYSLKVVTGFVFGGSTRQHIDEGTSFPENRTGCYYSCTGNTYYGRPNTAFSKGCLIRECPATLPRYLAPDSIVPTWEDPKRYQNHNSEGYSVHDDDWTYLSGSVPTRSGCFYRCNIEKGYREIRLTLDDGTEVVACTADLCPLKNRMFTFGHDYGSTVLPYDKDYSIVKSGWSAGHVWMREHIDENTSFPSDDGCYYHCSSGTYYGEYNGYTGCFELKCYYDWAIGIDNVITIKRPTKYLHRRTYSGTITDNTQATGCFYKCADGYDPVLKNGDLEKCVKHEDPIVEPEDPCIDTNGSFNTGNKAYCCELEQYKPYCCKFKEDDDKPYCCQLEEYKYDEEYCVPWREENCDINNGFYWDDVNKECIFKCDEPCKNISLGNGCGWSEFYNGCVPNESNVDCSKLPSGWIEHNQTCVYCPAGTWTPGAGLHGGLCVGS